MSNTIVRGTTPSLIVDFSGITDFAIADISVVSLIIKRRIEKIELGLADFAISDNTLIYHFSQEQTLAFNNGEILTLDMHVVANGERYKVNGVPDKVKVENTEKNNAFERIKELNGTRSEEETLEAEIEKEHNLKSFIKIEDNNTINVTVKNAEHNQELANKIMRTIQENYNEKKYISVKFQK